MIKKVTCNNHFIDFINDWNYKFYFLVGGYGSSKSYHVATKLLLKLASEKRLALVVREVYDTIRDSCFSLFEEKTSKKGNTHRVIWTYFESFPVLYPVYRPEDSPVSG